MIGKEIRTKFEKSPMRIAHLCLSNFFVDGVGYQENELVRQHVADGHDVLVIASTETHSAQGKLSYTKPADYIGAEGARIIRIPYRRFLPEAVMRKLRMHRGLYALLDDFNPSVILFHGTCGWELLTTAQYVEKNPNATFFVDSHEDQYNSARNLLSREILHIRYYGRILRIVLPTIKKILCVNLESMNFVASMYRIPQSNLEFYPLGGRPIPDNEYWSRRSITRAAHMIKDDQILVVQSGKQTHHRKTIDSIAAFSSCSRANFRLLIAGTIDRAIEKEVLSRIRVDSRIKFVGWKPLEELTDILCAADVYLLPAGQSATMQHSLCCRCAIILDDLPGHRMYVDQNGWLVGRDGSLTDIINRVGRVDIEKMKNASFKFAQDHLDYKILAKRILCKE